MKETYRQTREEIKPDPEILETLIFHWSKGGKVRKKSLIQICEEIFREKKITKIMRKQYNRKNCLWNKLILSSTNKPNRKGILTKITE